MDAFELLSTRASNGKLTDPAPDAESVRFALDAAARAPDHGILRPWRVHLIRGDARAKLGELMAHVYHKQNSSISADELAKTRSKALRAPLILVVSAKVEAHPKVAAMEQILAAGAAANNILLALHARGYAAIWRTGAPAYDNDLKQAFGLRAQDALVAFIYAGDRAARGVTGGWLQRALPQRARIIAGMPETVGGVRIADANHPSVLRGAILVLVARRRWLPCCGECGRRSTPLRRKCRDELVRRRDPYPLHGIRREVPQNYVVLNNVIAERSSRRTNEKATPLTATLRAL